MNLSITNLTAEILDQRYLASIKKSLTTFTPGYRYSKLYKLKKWDGKVCLVKDNRFPTGLLPNLKINPNITDNRPIKQLKLKTTSINLFDYQFEVVRKAFENTYQGIWWPRGVLKVATGGGKTHIAGAMIDMAQVPTVFLVNDRQLLNQTINRFKSFGLNPTDIDHPSNLVVTTVQSLMSWAYHRKEISENLIRKADRMIDFLKTIEQVFVDEAHLIGSTLKEANLFSQALNLMPNAYMRWGLTATPFMREEYHDWLLEAATGPVLADISTQYLIERGYLTKPEIFLHTMPKIKILKSWPECYDLGIVMNEQRNKKIASLIKDEPGPIMVLVERIGHGNLIKGYTDQLGLKVEFLSGDDSIEDRETVVKKLQKGTLKAAIATKIWDQGIDLPEVRTLIIAGGGKSSRKSIQRLGRGLRTSAGKTTVRVHDFIDDAAYTLYKHSLYRQATWLEEGHSIKVV